jgi:hypothetical protein
MSAKNTFLHGTISVINIFLLKPKKKNQMPNPKKTLKFRPIRELQTIQELVERLELMERDQRKGLLVDYLCDLRQESLWVMHELSTLGFDPVDFLQCLTEQ